MKNLFLIPVLALTMLSCKDNADRALTYDDEKQMAIDSMETVVQNEKIELAKQRAIDSMRMEAKSNRPIVVQNVAAPQGQATQTQTTTTTERKGWSSAAKGAVIGAGVGAVSGAIIDKKKPAKGAVIGGLIGAGAGAGTGAIIDAEKKKKANQ